MKKNNPMRGLLSALAFLAAGAVADAQVTIPLPSTARMTVGQSRLPMILPSSGTMANNGALTLTTALDQAYPSAYFYMPAGAIVVASAAGFYYGTMQSTTAVTLFNNVYVSGSPTIPTSPTAFATTGPGAYTQTTAAFFSPSTITIPGNTLGVNDEVQVHGEMTWANSAGVKTLSVSYGNFTYGSVALTTSASFSFQGGFANAGSQSRQAQTGGAGLNFAAIAGVPSNGAVNAATDQILAVQLKIAAAADYVILQSMVAERISAANN